VSTRTEPARLPRNPLFPLGVDYYPQGSDTSAPGEWYGDDFDSEFDAFRQARITLVRIYMSWKAFEPQVGVYSEQALSRLREIIESAGAHRLNLILCFFARVPGASLTDVAWGREKDPHTDPYLIERQAALIRSVVEAHCDDRAVFGWELADEAFCAAFESVADLESWVETMRDAVREFDDRHPVMVGADAETLFHTSRIDARAALSTCEVGIVHATPSYRGYIAEGPVLAPDSTHLGSYLLHCAPRGRPLLCDGIGPHTLDSSHAEEAALVRCALYATLMNGGSGALVRRWRDAAVERRTPYYLDPYEALVGLVDDESHDKASMQELRSFSRMVARLDLRALTRPVDEVAVLVPSERMAVPPTLASLYAPRSCLAAFARAKEAHLPVTTVREQDPYDPYAMIIVPSVTDLAEGSLEELATWVQRGGSLVYSYGGGEFGLVARELFGVDFLGHGGVRTKATCRIAQRDVLSGVEPFETRVDMGHFALLAPGEAIVLATDDSGNPLVTLNRRGQGQAICMAVPFERILGQGGLFGASAPVASFLRALYAAVGGMSGCAPKVTCDAFETEVVLLSGDDEDVLLLLNHYARDVTANVRFERRVASVSPVAGGSAVTVNDVAFGVPLGPFGVASLRIVYG
jgi:endo-1,4-beta-mannosidase